MLYYAVNKMDLIDYDENEFKNIVKQIKIMTGEYDFETMHIIPVSATVGDNITTESAKTPWYKGGTLQNYLETIDVTDHSDETGFVMPVQRVSRPDHALSVVFRDRLRLARFTSEMRSPLCQVVRQLR